MIKGPLSLPVKSLGDSFIVYEKRKINRYWMEIRNEEDIFKILSNIAAS
jgi:hypothetical protein